MKYLAITWLVITVPIYLISLILLALSVITVLIILECKA